MQTHVKQTADIAIGTIENVVPDRNVVPETIKKPASLGSMLVQSNGSTKFAHIEGVTRPDAYATNAGHASYSNIVVTGLKGDKPAPLAQWRVLKSTKR